MMKSLDMKFDTAGNGVEECTRDGIERSKALLRGRA